MSGQPIMYVPVSEGVDILFCPCSRVVRTQKSSPGPEVLVDKLGADWEHRCPACGRELVPRLVPPAESSPVRSAG